jgi:hypothetical protein
VGIGEADSALARAGADARRAIWVRTVYAELAREGALPRFGASAVGSDGSPKPLPLDAALRTGAVTDSLDAAALQRQLGYGRERFRPRPVPLARRPTLWGAALFAAATVAQFSEQQSDAAAAQARWRTDDGINEPAVAPPRGPNALGGAAATLAAGSASLARRLASFDGSSPDWPRESPPPPPPLDATSLSAAAVLGGAVQLGVPLLGGAALADALLLRGAGAEVARRALSPGRLELLATHEAGHVVVAHVLGCAVEAVSLSPWMRLSRADVPGGAGAGAGTLFVDETLGAQMSAGAVERSALERWCAVAMAGIAAEAECGGCAEGGAADEAAVRALLSTVGLSEPAVKAAAVRGATNAALLLREHRAAFERVAAALRQPGAGVEEAILALEEIPQ